MCSICETKIKIRLGVLDLKFVIFTMKRVMFYARLERTVLVGKGKIYCFNMSEIRAFELVS